MRVSFAKSSAMSSGSTMWTWLSISPPSDVVVGEQEPMSFVLRTAADVGGRRESGMRNDQSADSSIFRQEASELGSSTGLRRLVTPSIARPVPDDVYRCRRLHRDRSA